MPDGGIQNASSWIYVDWYRTEKTFMLLRLFAWHKKQKIENELRSLFRGERLQAVYLYFHLIPICGASVMSYLLPPRHPYPRRFSGLTLFEHPSLCFRTGSLGNKMQIPVSFSSLCAHSCTTPRSLVCVRWHQCLIFNIQVCARALLMGFDFFYCSGYLSLFLIAWSRGIKILNSIYKGTDLLF